MDEKNELSGRSYGVFLPWEAAARTPWPVILLNGDASMLALLEEEGLLPLKNCLVVMSLSENRLDDFTPWPERALNSRFPDFGGKAGNYLAWIAEDLLPYIQGTYPVCQTPSGRGMLGQSLGGLLVLYAQTIRKWNVFGHEAAISPSCWYPGFIPYMEANLPDQSQTRWFISCGTKEGKGQFDIKKSGVQKSRRMMALLREQYGEQQVWEQWDNGGHHDNLPLRYKHALSWLEEGFMHVTP